MRLTSWNILHGQGAPSLKVLADELAVGADDFVVGIQEVDAFQDRSDQVFQLSQIASALGANNFGFLRCVIGTPGVKWRKLRSGEGVLITNGSLELQGMGSESAASYGIGLITNIPVIRWEVLALGKSPIGLPLPFPADNQSQVNSSKFNPKLKFFYVKDEPRYAVAAQLNNGYTVVNVHLSFVPIINLIQLFRVKRWLGKMPGRHILLGDLNLPFNIPTKFSKWSSLVSMKSYPTWDPKIQFDYILSDNLEQVRIKPIFIESKVSDHLPVTIEIN